MSLSREKHEPSLENQTTRTVLSLLTTAKDAPQHSTKKRNHAGEHISKKKGIWKDGNEGNPGDTLEASISKKEMIISNHISADGASLDGCYPRIKSDNVHGRDGKTYYSYNAVLGDDPNRFLVDSNLLYPKKKGQIKFRSKGEGFFEQKFMCSDVDSSEKTVKRPKFK